MSRPSLETVNTPTMWPKSCNETSGPERDRGRARPALTQSKAHLETNEMASRCELPRSAHETGSLCWALPAPAKKMAQVP